MLRGTKLAVKRRELSARGGRQGGFDVRWYRCRKLLGERRPGWTNNRGMSYRYVCSRLRSCVDEMHVAYHVMEVY